MIVCALIGPSDPEQPTLLSPTGTSFNGTTIQWTVARIAYTPETYTVHFGTSPGSLTPFNQQRQSGDNFTATNLQFSVQLTGLTPATDYSYQVVATNTINRNATSVIGMFRTLDVRKCDVCVATSVSLPLMHCSLNSLTPYSSHWSCSEHFGCHSGWSANSADILMGPTATSWQEWYHHWLPALLWSPAQYLPKGVQPVRPSEHHYHSECVHSWNLLHLPSVA